MYVISDSQEWQVSVLGRLKKVLSKPNVLQPGDPVSLPTNLLCVSAIKKRSSYVGRVSDGRIDRTELKRWLRSRAKPSGEVMRARILLSLIEGQPITELARAFHVSHPTVYFWKRRYFDEGIAGLVDRCRPSCPTTLQPKDAERFLLSTIQRVPKEATHWSTRLMARYAGLSQCIVRQVWSEAYMKPNRIKSLVRNDTKFTEKVIAVIGLYINSPGNAMVLSVNENALERPQKLVPIRPGEIDQRTHDYERHGTTSLYAAFNVATGQGSRSYNQTASV